LTIFKQSKLATTPEEVVPPPILVVQAIVHSYL